jgi:hypothetical protein
MMDFGDLYTFLTKPIHVGLTNEIYNQTIIPLISLPPKFHIIRLGSACRAEAIQAKAHKIQNIFAESVSFCSIPPSTWARGFLKGGDTYVLDRVFGWFPLVAIPAGDDGALFFHDERTKRLDDVWVRFPRR